MKAERGSAAKDVDRNYCEWIKRVSWADSKVYVDLSRDTIKNDPEYNPSAPPDRDHESRLYEHYGRSEYWSH